MKSKKIVAVALVVAAVGAAVWYLKTSRDKQLVQNAKDAELAKTTQTPSVATPGIVAGGPPGTMSLVEQPDNATLNDVMPADKYEDYTSI